MNFLVNLQTLIIMHKIIAVLFLSMLTHLSIAQDKSEVKAQVSISQSKQLQADRDTVKSQLRLKNQERTRDINKLVKTENSNKSLKDQLNSAKKAKKMDKIESLETKIADNKQTIKDLDVKIKADEKEIDQLEKDLKRAEKELKSAKENEAKEKAKGKK